MIAENTAISARDATLHAEQNLASAAYRIFERSILSESTLYSNLEPCLMCATAIYWA